jgi:ElaB/YqjD/DUF883 family membrane-anchored ribosome-binding protein
VNAESTGFNSPDPVYAMTQMLDNVAETLNEDLYQKTRAQLNAFLEETNALLAAGDALHEDRTAQARERLAEFLEGAELEAALETPARAQVPPLTRVMEDTQNFVKANPWAAVGAAAGVGLIVSMLFIRGPR